MERICFQVEEAQWFYEDFIRPLDPALPTLSLKAFALRIFQHCPLMSQWSHYHHMAAFSEFLAYKTRVPVRGAILLNEEMDEVVLVKGWKKSANWSFPRGKINKGEKDLDCAIREVYEETGFDVRAAGLVPQNEQVKAIEITMREQHMQLFVFTGVPRDTQFEPRTRKEISKIEWYKLSELPTLRKNKQHDEGMAVANANKFYMVAPFLHPLKKWIAQQKKTASKAQAGAKLGDEYISMDENQMSTPALHPATELAAPSDLPEVAAVADASSHLKRLLRIGASIPAEAAVQPPVPSYVDQSKSDALLDLLRKGSRGPVPHAQQQTLPPPISPHPGAQPAGQPAHLAPNFFPGFPQQQQHAAPTFMQQSSPHPSQEPQQANTQLHNSLHRSVDNGSHHACQNEPSGFPAAPNPIQMPAQNYPMHVRQFPPSNAMQQKQTAPFQHTGDPQFSQPTQSAQAFGARIPPASKLPPPKLTSHSLKLLDVFRGDASRVTQSFQPAASVAPAQGPQNARKTSQHQDSLLGLFKGPRVAPSPQPVELGGHPVPAVKQILQRPSQQTDSSIQPGDVHGTRTGPYHASGTGPAPMQMAHREMGPKSTPKEPANGSHRRSDSSRREPVQLQLLSSPITILPRPQSAKRNASISRPQSQATPPPLQSRTHQPAAPEPVKPFQPQILRRPERPGSGETSRVAPNLENVDRNPTLPGLQTPASERAPQKNFDRRPSQSAAQKEALLSLFGKAPVSPSRVSAAQPESGTANQQPSTISGLVSPLSSCHLPSSGDSVSRHGTPSEGEATSNRIASPTNKEFLLGYLQGVAKGNK